MKRNLTDLHRGDDRTISLHFTDAAGANIPITGWTIFFTLKLNKSDTDANAKLKKDVTVHTVPLEGKSEIVLANTDTNDLTVGKLYYDIQVKKASGQVLTVAWGTIPILEDITRRTVAE